MQRIKSQSQSICQPQNHSNTSQSRPRSKKTTKAQSSQIIYNLNERTKNNNAPITEQSMVSIKSGGRPLSGSMKNLRVPINNQSTAKCSAQNTSRGINGQNSAISARILKEIVGYAQRGPSKPKGTRGDSNFHQTKQEPTIKIDLTEQIQNLYSAIGKQEAQQRTTLTNNRNNSQQPSQNKDRQTGNSSDQKNRHKIQHRVVEQFSPLNRSPEYEIQSKAKLEIKKGNFFDGSYKEQALKAENCRSELSNRNVSLFNDQKDYELSRANYDTWKNYSSFNDVEEDNKLEITNNFLKIASPHHLLTSLEKSDINKVLQKHNINLMPVISMKSTEKSMNKNKKVNLNEGKTISQDDFLLKQKQRLIVGLEDANAILEEHYEFKFKQLVQFWKGIIDSQSKQKKLISEIKELQKALKIEQQKDLAKKTQLFQLNRDQICRRKQKDYFTKSNKDKYIHEAASCQEGLRLKLSSKADYEHMILFNQKVVLTGRNSTQDLEQLFTQMFDSKLSKKFALIAKKEIANLSVYDSRLIQDFLKRIQQLESMYNKSQGHTASQTSQYCSADEQLRLETLVQQIQQITLSLQYTNSKVNSKKNELTEMRRRVQKLKQIIQEHIKSMNEKVSGQYKMVQGYSFDFQILLEQKYAKQFQNYRKQVEERDKITSKLVQIEKKIANLSNNKQNYSLMDYNSHAKANANEQGKSSRMRQSDGKSMSFVSTPTASPMREKSEIQENMVWMFRKAVK